MTATRIQLEALESRVQMLVDHGRGIAVKLEELSVRVDALTQVFERIDLRVLSLEHRMDRSSSVSRVPKERVERLEQRVERLQQRVERLERPEDS